MTEKRGVSRRPKVVIYVRILMINGYVRTCTGRKGDGVGEMPRSRSLVKAFDLIPVVEKVLPDRQKTEVRRSDRFTSLTSVLIYGAFCSSKQSSMILTIVFVRGTS